MSTKNKWAKIIDGGRIYSSYDILANSMGLKRFKSEFTCNYDLNDEDCIIIDYVPHDGIGAGPFYGIYVPSLDRDYIIHGSGIKLLDTPVYKEMLDDDLFEI